MVVRRKQAQTLGLLASYYYRDSAESRQNTHTFNQTTLGRVAIRREGLLFLLVFRYTKLMHSHYASKLILETH